MNQDILANFLKFQERVSSKSFLENRERVLAPCVFQSRTHVHFCVTYAFLFKRNYQCKKTLNIKFSVTNKICLVGIFTILSVFSALNLDRNVSGTQNERCR